MTHLEEFVRSISQEDLLRSRFYGLLARLLRCAPDHTTIADLRRLEGDDTPMGSALARLAAASQMATAETARDEFAALFVGLTEGELRPYTSYYLTGFLYEKPLAKLREDMAALGVARAPNSYEPEDHIASLCEIMHGLITGAFDAPAQLDDQKAFFDAHLDPWAFRFFEDLEQAHSAVLYRPVGTVGQIFMAIEHEAFSMVH